MGTQFSEITKVPNIQNPRVVIKKSNQAVFRATHSLTLQTVYVKIYRKEEAFRRESAALFQLQNTGVVPRTVECPISLGRDAITPSLIINDAGQTIKDIKSFWTRLALYTFIHGFLSALDLIHSQNWMHGDVHPSNVCFADKRVKLIDFGQSDPIGESRDGVRPGHPEFRAPEFKAAQRAPASAEADTYSAGKVVEWVLKQRCLVENATPDDKSFFLSKVVTPLLKEDPAPRAKLATVVGIVAKAMEGVAANVKSLQSKALKRLVERLDSDPQGNLTSLTEKGGILFADIFERVHYLTAIWLINEAHLETETVRTMADLDRMYHELETKHRKLFATERANQALDDPYVLCMDMFASPMHYERVALTEEEQKYFFCFEKSMTQIPIGEPVAVRTYADFECNWNAITSGMFRYVNFANVFIAGGIVLAALQPSLDASAGGAALADNTYFNSDIDVFFYGLSLEQVEAKTLEVFKAIQKAVREDAQGPSQQNLLAVRNIRSLTILGEYPRRQIQFVFRLFRSPAEVLMGFDIDSCCFGFNGKAVYALPRALRALTRRYNLVDMTRRSASYEYRLFKYGKRGFATAVPNVDASKIPQRGPMRGDGLARLITLESNVLLTRYHREKSKGIRREQAELVEADREMELMLQNKSGADFSHYQLIKIPYGEKWPLDRIIGYLSGFLNVISLGANNYGSNVERLPYFRVMDDDNDENDISVQYSDDEDVMGLYRRYIFGRTTGNPLPIAFQRNGIRRVLKARLDNLSKVGGKVDFVSSWMTTNPGQQLLSGSFEPLETTWDEWLADAYKHEFYDPLAEEEGGYDDDDGGDEDDGGYEGGGDYGLDEDPDDGGDDEDDEEGKPAQKKVRR